MAEFDYFEELKASLGEAIEYKNGRHGHVRVTVRELTVPQYKADDIARMRTSLRLSQRAMANVLGVSPRTVEAWESGKNVPNGTAQHLLYLIEKDHALVDRFIAR